MKTIKGIIGATFLFVAVTAIAIASVPPSDTAGLQIVPSDQVPPSGTFWILETNGITAPLPCPPANMADAPIYNLGDGQFLVDERNGEGVSLSAALSAFDSLAEAAPLGGATPMDSPTVFSNAWFSQIVISNHSYISLSNAVLDFTGNLMTHQFPSGVMFVVTSTSLTVPTTQWQPVGPTNAIGNSAFQITYNPASAPVSFYRICAQLNTNIPAQLVIPFSLMATNFGILTDQEVSLTWTNGQPGLGAENDTIVEEDTNGHSYLVSSLVTTGAVGTFSFELQKTNGLTFIRYSAPANTSTDQFFLPTNYFNSPDVVTVPYVVSTNSGRDIVDVAAYDVTDPSNPQFLAHVASEGSNAGTLEIPGVSLYPGVDTLEFRAIDSGFGQTATDFTITNSQLVSVVSPVLTLEPNGTNRIAASGGGYGIGFEAVTTATNGTWVVNIYDPVGDLVGTASAAVTNIGQDIIYDDGSTPSTVYPDPFYDIQVTVDPPGNQPLAPADPPAPVNTKFIRVYLLPPQGNAGSIVGYDDTALPSSPGDQQTVLGVMANSLSQMFEFDYQIIDFGDGIWKTVGNPTAIDLNNPPGLGWGWTALQAGLSGVSYTEDLPPTFAWTNQTPDRPILGIAIHGHGGIDEFGVAQGVQGPNGPLDSTVTAQSLQQFGFNKDTNAVAIAVLTGCRIGSGPFMQFILRDKGQPGQISASTATANHIRPCFGIAWTTELSISSEPDQFGWISEWCLYVSAFGGSGSSPFLYTLDDAFTQAQFNYSGNGGDNAVWSGTAGRTLDLYSQ